MNRNSAGTTNDQRRSASQSFTKQQLSGILNYDFIDPSEDYPSARAKENSFTQQLAPGHTSMYTSFPVEDERSSIKFNGTGKFSPAVTMDQSITSKSKGPAPPNIDYKSNSAVRTKSYSPISSHKKSATRRSPQHSKGHAEMSQSFYESSGQKKMNLPTSSVNVMRRVFDEDYSLSSPNKRLVNESQQEIGDIDASVRFDERSRDHLSSVYVSKPKGPEVNFEFLDRAYQILLAKIKANPNMTEASMDDYIKESVEYLTNSDTMLRTGALINLFDILYYNAQAIVPEYVTMICTQIFNLLPHYYTTDDFYFSYLSMEILHLLGPNDIVYNHIKFLLAILTDEKFPKVQERAFKVLANLDYPGLYALFDLASKDFDDVPFYVLNQLAQVPEIQARIIVPALLNDLGTTDNKKRIASLAALNRMLGMVKMGGGLPILISLLQEGSLDRQLLASTILAAGPAGETTLLKILKTTNNTKIKQAVCSAMSWRVPDPNKIKLKIEVIPYQVSQHYNLNPGTMCVYSGDLRPVFLAETAEKNGVPQEDKIEINSRDFLAALNRYISLKYQDFALRDTQSYPKDQEDFKDFNNFNTYVLERFLKNEPQEGEKDPNQQDQISPNIIKALIAQYNDRDKLVRESVVNTLGLIGYPEAVEALDMLVKALYDGEAQIRAVAAWAIGKLGEVAAIKASRRLVELLRDNFWKVRTSACIALGCMGDSADTALFAILVKALRDGSINKVVVCETLVRLGERGEFIILDILKKVPNVNYVLKAALIQSLELAEVNRATIDFVIEELFRNAADSMVQVRRACLVTLEKLRLKSHGNNITYLKSKNILPLFYYFLQDPSNEIRSMALQSIYSFGPQGELMLIEGLAKDKNSTIRAECAKGLGLYGPHTFRALIFGLRDPEENVRTATASALKKNFTPDEVINNFREKYHQIPAIICSIREIMNLNYYYQKATKEYLETILNFFQTEMNHNKSTLETRMTSSFAKERPETFYTQEHEDRPLQYGFSPSASQQKDLSMSKSNAKEDSYLDQFRVENF